MCTNKINLYNNNMLLLLKFIHCIDLVLFNYYLVLRSVLYLNNLLNQ